MRAAPGPAAAGPAATTALSLRVACFLSCPASLLHQLLSPSLFVCTVMMYWHWSFAKAGWSRRQLLLLGATRGPAATSGGRLGGRCPQCWQQRRAPGQPPWAGIPHQPDPSRGGSWAAAEVALGSRGGACVGPPPAAACRAQKTQRQPCMRSCPHRGLSHTEAAEGAPLRPLGVVSGHPCFWNWPRGMRAAVRALGCARLGVVGLAGSLGRGHAASGPSALGALSARPGARAADLPCKSSDLALERRPHACMR